jgi:hypothetical protein
MRSTLTFLVVSVSVGLASCYDVHTPLDATPQVQVDQALLGEWRCLPMDPDPEQKAGTFVFVATGERTYDINMPEDNEGGEKAKEETTPSDETQQAEGLKSPLVYPSILDGATVLNIRNDDRTWTLVRYSYLLPNVVRFELVTDSAGDTPAELRETLHRAGVTSDVYEDFLLCVRVPERK